jgi:molybdopterin-guanine dinucleotide biosynthesis protein
MSSVLYGTKPLSNRCSRWNQRARNSATQLTQLIHRLCDAEIDFVIVGGFAGILHGSTLVTRDLDICAVLSFFVPDQVDGGTLARCP